MPGRMEFQKLLEKTDLTDGRSIERYAVRLEGMTFRDVLELDIHPAGGRETDFSKTSNKGGLGALLEERYFGYRANSRDEPDFPEAGVELKATPYDTKKDGRRAAGERLKINMIPQDRPIEVEFDSSHCWAKCQRILLVYYGRDRSIDRLDQRIEHVRLFTPPEEDLEVIRADYAKIVSYVTAGRADELSEGLTDYLGASTAGATSASSWRVQYYPRVAKDGTRTYTKARRRAFCLKQRYMDYVLHTYLEPGATRAEQILEGSVGAGTLEERVLGLVAPHVGKADIELCAELGVPYTASGKNANAQWTSLAYRMLGIHGNRAEEFLKAGISVRAVRLEEDGRMKESLSFAPFEFRELAEEEWDDSEFRSYLDQTRFFFVVFGRSGGCYRLQGAAFWAMPATDIEGEARRCWEGARATVRGGVRLERKRGRVTNNLPKAAENRCCHVRPHAGRAYYRLADGYAKGENQRDGSQLPDGQWMTKQSFWLNNGYVSAAIAAALEQQSARV